MPNRIIKESICTSDTVDSLSWLEEVFFYRLMVNADDYGRCDARPAILKARLFPLKSMNDKMIEQGLLALQNAGILELYTVVGKPYLQLCTWAKHQTIRNHTSKYPSPEERDTQPIEINCKQLKSIASKCPRNPIQSVSESNPDPMRESTDPPPKPTRCVYGEYKNVKLSDDELEKLKYEFPPDWQQRIDRLSEYMASKGVTYKDHLATIRAWARKDKDGAGTNGKKVSFQDYDQGDDIPLPAGLDLLAEARDAAERLRKFKEGNQDART